MIATDGLGFVKLPNERILYTSPARTSLLITTPEIITGTASFTVKSDAGIVYVTNQRLVYLPSSPTPGFKSFSSPILNLSDAYIHTPLLGANFWSGKCKPVPGGGIPPPHPVAELKLTFRDGGVFDFHTIYEQIKEVLYQAYSVAQESSQQNIDLSNLDLEPLPVYKTESEMREEDRMENSPAYHMYEPERVGAVSNLAENDISRPIPAEAPPGYEDMQVQAVHIDLEQRLRREAENSAVTAT